VPDSAANIGSRSTDARSGAWRRSTPDELPVVHEKVEGVARRNQIVRSVAHDMARSRTHQPPSDESIEQRSESIAEFKMAPLNLDLIGRL
jgi:hypothetical protein